MAVYSRLKLTFITGTLQTQATIKRCQFKAFKLTGCSKRPFRSETTDNCDNGMSNHWTGNELVEWKVEWKMNQLQLTRVQLALLNLV